MDAEKELTPGEEVFNGVVVEFREAGLIPGNTQIKYSDDFVFSRNGEVVRFGSMAEAQAAGFYGSGIAGCAQSRVADGKTQSRIMIFRGAANSMHAIVAMSSMDRATWRPIVFTRYGMMRFTIAHEIRHLLDSSLGDSTASNHWRANEYAQKVCRQLGGGCG